MGVIYVALQLAIFLSLIFLGILKIVDAQYPPVIITVVGTVSFLFAVITVFYTARMKLIESMQFRKSGRLWREKKKYIMIILDFSILFMGSIGLLLVIVLNYYKLISSNVNDMISIFTLAVSLSNELLATWCIRFCIFLADCRQNAYNKKNVA